MEQRIGPIIPPVHSAGTDPAYIPGLMASRPAEEEKPAPEDVAEPPPEDAVPEEDAAATDGAGREEAGTEEAGREEAVDGPVFEVSDHRSTLTADRTGITLQLDGEKAEFGWDEIGAVKIDTPRFGRRFAVTVYLTTRRWYQADVEAPARKLLTEWTAELDAVLDVYFESPEP